MSKNNKTADICSVLLYKQVAGAEVKSSPIDDFARISGPSEILRSSGFEFSEKTNQDESFDIEFRAKITDTSEESFNFLLKYNNTPIYIVLQYSNGLRRLVGNERQPLMAAIELTGKPASYYLTVKQTQSERCKLLK